MKRRAFLELYPAAALLLGAGGSSGLAQGGTASATAETTIKQIMQQQVEDWNRGDVETFMRGYKDSPDITFIGKTIQHGYAMILERYRKSYPTRESMGTLHFSDLEVRSLGPQYALVTGEFHLVRAAAGGGDANGVFSLIWEKTPQGWKTILDHTS